MPNTYLHLHDEMFIKQLSKSTNILLYIHLQIEIIWGVYSTLQCNILFCLLFLFQLHTDLDVGNKNIKYVLAGEGAGTIFAINELTGDIHAMKRLDREEKAEYTLTAQVINADTDEPLEPPSEFIIKVQDINDNSPQFIEGPYRASVPEMSAVGKSQSTDLIPSLHHTQQPNQWCEGSKTAYF